MSGTDDDEADAHVERAPHVINRHTPGALKPLENRWNGP
jgi:hypothetical protein